jgi:O-antigen/teichoic acid export membrane protein
MSTKVTYSKNALAVISNRIIEGFLALLLASVMAHKLSKGDVGIYTVLMTATMMFSIFSEFGTRMILVREVSKNKKDAPLLLSSTLILRGGFTFICILALIFFVNLKWSTDYVLNASYVFILFLIPYYLSEVVQAVFTGFEKNEYTFAASIPAKLVGNITAIVMLLLGYNLIYVFSALTFSFVLRAVFSFYILKKRLFTPKLYIDIHNMVFLLKESAPLAIMNGLSQLFSRTGLFMLWFFRGDEETGNLGVITIVINIFSNLGLNLILPLFPVLSRLNDNKAKYEDAYRRFLKYLFIITLPMGFGIYALADKLVLLLYGQSYLLTIPGLKITVLSGVIYPFIVFFINILTSVGLQKLNTYYSLYSFIIALVLNAILIPFFGFIGVCIANVIGSMFYAVFCYRAILKSSVASFKWCDVPIRQTLAAFIMYAFMNRFSLESLDSSKLMIGWDIIWISSIGLIIYIAALFLSGAIDKYDRSSIKEIFIGLKVYSIEKFKNLRTYCKKSVMK